MFRVSQVVISILLLSLNATVKSERLIGLLQDLVDQKFEKLNISEKCEQNLIEIRHGLAKQSIWALKLLDASGHIPTDFIWGNNMFTGAPTACTQSNTKIVAVRGVDYIPISYPNLTEITPPFPVAYRAAHARHKSKMQLDSGSFEKNVVDFGFCMPIACTDGDAKVMFKELLRNDTFLSTTLIGPGAELLQTKIVGFPKNFLDSPFVKIFLTVVFVMTSLVILERIYKSFKSSSQSYSGEKSKPPVWEKVLSCFSFSENYRTIVSSKSAKNSIKVLHGLKFHAMNLIIISHVGLFGGSALTNYQHLYIYIEQPWMQLLHATHLSVGTFFAVSATLFSYVFFEYVKEDKIKNSFVFGIKATLARYFRLTPPYVIQVLMLITIDRIVKEASPFYLMDDSDEKCSRLWWQNFLYINNFIDMRRMCITSSYFLATDFQLFLISLIFLLIIKRNKFIGLFLFGSFITICLAICGYLGYILHHQPVVTDIVAKGVYLYTPFWANIGSYSMGLIAGWYISYKNRTLPLGKMWISILWIVAVCILFGAFFTHIKGDVSQIFSLFYNLLLRLFWSMAISWMIVACASKNGGLFGRSLASKVSIFFGRISYSAYLIHPIMIHILTMFNEFPFRLDFGLLTVYIFGYVCCVYISSFLFTIIFEVPFVRLFKLLI